MAHNFFGIVDNGELKPAMGIAVDSAATAGDSSPGFRYERRAWATGLPYGPTIP